MSPNSPNERLIALESSIAHLQHQSDQMHEVILAQQDEIAVLRRELARVSGRLERMGEPDEPADPAAERPPHY